MRIDPQILLYAMKEYDLSGEEINRILNKESGLKGVSEISSDLRKILAEMEKGNDRAKLAFEIYIHYLKKAIASQVASLNGLDVLVFTAGVGENSAIVREKTCGGLSYLGLQLDIAKNNTHSIDTNIAMSGSLPILVIQTQEDWAIAIASYGLTAN